jgi:hypothetical protein
MDSIATDRFDFNGSNIGLQGLAPEGPLTGDLVDAGSARALKSQFKTWENAGFARVELQMDIEVPRGEDFAKIGHAGTLA